MIDKAPESGIFPSDERVVLTYTVQVEALIQHGDDRYAPRIQSAIHAAMGQFRALGVRVEQVTVEQKAVQTKGDLTEALRASVR